MTIQWIEEPFDVVGQPPDPGAVDWFEGEPQWGDHSPAGLAGGFGLGQVPTACPGGGGTPAAYTACRQQALNSATSSCPASQFQTPGGGTDEVALAQCIQANYFANFTASNCFQHCPAAQTPCTSETVIRFAQEQLGRSQTGVWTAADQAALAASGETFQQLVGSCGGAAPVPVSGPPPPPECPAGQQLDANGQCVPIPPIPVAKKKSGAGLGVVLLAAAAATAIALAQT